MTLNYTAIPHEYDRRPCNYLANPLANTFDFDTFDEFKQCQKSGVSYLFTCNNPDYLTMFEDLDVTQDTLELYFNDFAALISLDRAKVVFLVTYHDYSIEDIDSSVLKDVYLFEGTAREYTEENVENTRLLYKLPNELKKYFDYESFAKDLQRKGAIKTFEIDNQEYVTDWF